MAARAPGPVHRRGHLRGHGRRCRGGHRLRHRGGAGPGRRSPDRSVRGPRRPGARGGARADQHAPPLLPDAHARLGARGQRPPVPVAAGPLPRVGPSAPPRPAARDHGGDGGAAALGLHHGGRPPLPVPRRHGALDRRAGRGRPEPRHAGRPLPGIHEPGRARRRAAPAADGAGGGDDPRRQRTPGGDLPRARRRRPDPDRAGPVLTVLGDAGDHAGHRRPGRRAGRAAAHPPRRDHRRGGLLPGALRAADGRLPRVHGLAHRPDVAGPRHPLRRRRGGPPGRGRGGRGPLPHVQHAPGLRDLPGRGARGGGSPRGARGGRVRLQRRLQPGAGGPAGPVRAAAALRGGGRDPGAGPRLGDARLRAPARAPGPRCAAPGRPGGPRDVPAGRAALLRRPRPALRVAAVRRGARGPGHGGRALARGGRCDHRAGRGGAHRRALRGGPPPGERLKLPAPPGPMLAGRAGTGRRGPVAAS